MPSIHHGQVVDRFSSAVFEFSLVKMFSIFSRLSTVGIEESSTFTLSFNYLTLPVLFTFSKCGAANSSTRDLLRFPARFVEISIASSFAKGWNEQQGDFFRAVKQVSHTVENESYRYDEESRDRLPLRSIFDGLRHRA